MLHACMGIPSLGCALDGRSSTLAAPQAGKERSDIFYCTDTRRNFQRKSSQRERGGPFHHEEFTYRRDFRQKAKPLNLGGV